MLDLDLSAFGKVKQKLDTMTESVASFKFQNFTDKKIFRFAKKIFPKFGLSLDSVKISKKPRRIQQTSVHDVEMLLDNGLKVFLFVTFETKGKSPEPRDRGIIFGAAVGSKSNAVPFSREKNEDLPWDKVLGTILNQAKTMIPRQLKKKQRLLERKTAAKDLKQTDEATPETKRLRTVGQKIKSTEALVKANQAQAEQLAKDKAEYTESLKTGGDKVVSLKNRVEELDAEIAAAETQLQQLKSA